jgi:hypothetical protein
MDQVSTSQTPDGREIRWLADDGMVKICELTSNGVTISEATFRGVTEDAVYAFVDALMVDSRRA